jgi:hypothetical protein
MNPFTDAELAAFIDEALPPDRSSELETALRADESLRRRLIEVQGRDSAGLHTIGAIWRTDRLSCPDRDELAQYLLDILGPGQTDYIRFHIETIGCRYCAANLEDLKVSTAQSAAASAPRRQKYFQTSAGYLRPKNKP